MVDKHANDQVAARFFAQRGAFTLDVDFAVPARGVTALFGPSGCGKTSILRCIAGLDRLGESQLSVKGSVWQDANSFVPTHKRPLGYVFQEASLFPHLSVMGNLTYGRKRSWTASVLDVMDVARLLGIDKLLERAPGHLSGGERQRVAIGRALLSAPEILLMDEPLASLDRFAKNDILPYLERLHDELAIPVIYVSHDIAEVERLADRMILLESGRVRASGAVQDMLIDPALPFSREPDAAIVLDARICATEPDYGLTTLAVSGAEIRLPSRTAGHVGSAQRLRIVASDVAICRGAVPEGLSILNALAARITGIEPMGAHQVSVHLALGSEGEGATLLSHITRKSAEGLDLKTGDSVHALIKSAALVKQS